jgi:hypothetical protein
MLTLLATFMLQIAATTEFAKSLTRLVLQEGLFPLSQVQRKAMPMGLGLLLNSMRR